MLLIWISVFFQERTNQRIRSYFSSGAGKASAVHAKKTKRTKKMAVEDKDYFEKRAEAEIAMAQRATNASVVRAHYELATAYLDLIYGDAPGAGEQAA